MRAASEGPAFDWDRLLDLIEDRRVVPVVGPGLSLVENAERTEPLERWLTRLLAERARVDDFDPEDLASLNRLAVAWRRRNRPISELHEYLASSRRDLDALAPPLPLRQIAALPFGLYLSTTIDNVLRRALDEARFRGNPGTTVRAFFPEDRIEDLSDPPHPDWPVVFHLFGRIQSAPLYAVTDEDVLECMCALQSESRRPRRLFETVSTANLLLLGSSFSDWLARFFLRSTRPGRLSQAERRFDVLADKGLEDEKSLVLFLESFSAGTRVFRGGDAPHFVSELSRRWQDRHPAPSFQDEARPAPSEASGAVFISYANGDRPYAEALSAHLKAARIDVWFDRDRLECGDHWKRKIRRAVEEAALFLPILSRNCLDPKPRFFREEWTLAVDRLRRNPRGQSFIFPVVIDDVEEEHPAFEDFRGVSQFGRLAGLLPDPAFFNSLTRKYREVQEAHAAFLVRS